MKYFHYKLIFGGTILYIDKQDKFINDFMNYYDLDK